RLRRQSPIGSLDRSSALRQRHSFGSPGFSRRTAELCVTRSRQSPAAREALGTCKCASELASGLGDPCRKSGRKVRAGKPPAFRPGGHLLPGRALLPPADRPGTRRERGRSVRAPPGGSRSRVGRLSDLPFGRPPGPLGVVELGGGRRLGGSGVG